MIARERGVCGWVCPGAVCAILLVTAGCAARRPFTPPGGPEGPAPEAPLAWEAASGHCRAISSYHAEFGLTGTIGERRVRGLASARLTAAVTSAGAIGLEATVSGQLIFRMGGSSERATLVLRDPNRVLAATPEDVLAALIGVGLRPARLLAVFGGCVVEPAAFSRAIRRGDVLEVVAGDAVVYLERASGSWRVRAGRFGGVSVEYLDWAGPRPREIWLRSRADGGPGVSLTLVVRRAITNSVIAPAAFEVAIPADAVSMTLDELRQAGPLGENDAGR